MKRRPAGRCGDVAARHDFLDLAEAVERGTVGDEGPNSNGLRARYTLELGTWEAMIANLLGQLVADVGSIERALTLLEVRSEALIHAWTQDAAYGVRASARWMEAALDRRQREQIALTPSVLMLRGDGYFDLAEAAEGIALVGDGALDPARLRRRYTIERAPWLRMVGDLLAQVVGDAGSPEYAATVLGVPRDELTQWVRWLVSRGSITAATSRWPVAPVDDMPTDAAYLDLVEAVERGGVAGDNALDQPQVRDRYTVQFDSWERMSAELLEQIITDVGSLRRVSKVIDVPRSTLGAWVSRAKRRGSQW